MRLSYDLKIEQTQKLTMTPELIQAISILQYNSQELKEYIEKEVLENPVLDIDESNSKTDYSLSDEKMNFESEEAKEEAEFIEKIKDVDYDDISYNQWKYSKKDNESSFEDFASKPETLEDNLLLQLTFSNLKGIEKKIGRYIINSLDDNGYTNLKVKEIAAAFGVDTDLAGGVLDVIQTFEPVGVGARSLEECLIIQLASKGLLEDSIEYVILHHLKDIAEGNLSLISKKTGLSLNEVQLIKDLISTLNPKPGKGFAANAATKYIVPDVIVEKVGDTYQIISNDANLPKVVISNYYKDLASNHTNDRELNKYLNFKYESAQWLIRNIEQRKQTILNVASEIVKYQLEFFNSGKKYLKTLKMKQIAEELGIHESTVSRSINGKYMQSPQGVFELKYFFSSGVSNLDGDGISSNSIKTIMQEMIDSEDSAHPYSDQTLVEMLSESGIEISRRTVAKYRESMNILPSSKRRRY